MTATAPGWQCDSEAAARRGRNMTFVMTPPQMLRYSALS